MSRRGETYGRPYIVEEFLPKAPFLCFRIGRGKLRVSIREDLQEAYKVADKVARQELVATAKNKGLDLLETEDEINVANDVAIIASIIIWLLAIFSSN